VVKKTVLEIYALAVCFVTVVCFVVSLGFGIYGVIGMISPEFTMSSLAYTQHQTNDAFWSGPTGWSGPIGPRLRGPDEKMKERPSEPELSKQREESYARALASERRDNAQVAVKALIVIVIDLVVFLFHWLVARRARASVA
jgi:hypothetical protein